MPSNYYYSIAILITGLIIQQLFYIRKKYSQQNIKILEYYLHMKLTSRILQNFYQISHQKEEVKNLIKQYYYLDEIIIYSIKEKRFELDEYRGEKSNLINQNIKEFEKFLLISKPNQIYKMDKVNNIYSIYYPSKNIIIFFIKNISGTHKNQSFNKTEIDFLESIILPLLIMKYNY